MEPLFDFIGQYWWLAFPLFGVLAGVGNAWERGAKRRHQRRLEVIKAKAQVKTAQIAARSGQASPVTQAIDAAVAAGAVPRPTATGDTQADQLSRLFAEHDAVTKRWLEYELDVAKMIAFPAMSDGRQPLTAAYLRAKRVADGLRPASPKAKLTHEQFAEYRSAVTDYEVAFDLAERDARRIKDTTFSEVERKRLDTAKQLLTIAIDQAATPAERQLAYRRVRQELDGLISLSDEAIVVLEEQVALQITTGSDADAAPEASASAAPPAAPAATPAPEPLPVQRPAQWPVPSREHKPLPETPPGTTR